MEDSGSLQFASAARSSAWNFDSTVGCNDCNGAPHIPQYLCSAELSAEHALQIRRDSPADGEGSVGSAAISLSLPRSSCFSLISLRGRTEADSTDALSSRSKSETAWPRFSGGLVKYTSAHRPICAAKTGFSSGFNSGSGNSCASNLSLG